MGSKKILKVCLDLDDTLMPTNYRYDEATWRCGLIIAKALGPRAPRPESVIGLQKEIDEKLFKTFAFKVERFPRSWMDTYAVLAEKAKEAADPQVSKRLFNTAGHFKYGPFGAFHGSKKVLRKLCRAGYVLHLITAGEDFLQRRKVEQSGIARYFEPENIHVSVGDKRVEMRAIIGDLPQTAVMVGDSKRNDIRPANELGMISVWLPSETRSREDPRIVPAHEIGTIDELPALLEKLEAAKGQKKG